MSEFGWWAGVDKFDLEYAANTTRGRLLSMPWRKKVVPTIRVPIVYGMDYSSLDVQNWYGTGHGSGFLWCGTWVRHSTGGEHSQPDQGQDE